MHRLLGSALFCILLIAFMSSHWYASYITHEDKRDSSNDVLWVNRHSSKDVAVWADRFGSLHDGWPQYSIDGFKRPSFVYTVRINRGNIKGSSPPPIGDWVVDTVTVIEDSVLIINGSIIVEDSGALVLKNTTIYMNLDYDGEHYIDVYGNLTSHNSTITAYNTSNNYYIKVNSGAKFFLNCSEVYYAGYEYGSDWEKSGIWINTSDAKIMYSKIMYHYFGIIAYGANNFYIVNTTILCGGEGIILHFSPNSFVANNTITNNSWTGISIYASNSTVVENNLVQRNNDNVVIYYSSNCRISNNNILEGRCTGLVVTYSWENEIKNNTFIGCGIVIMSLPTVTYSNTIQDNTVNGKPLIYLEDASNLNVSGTAGQVVLVKCSEITIANMTISNTTIGIELYMSHNIEVVNNTLINNFHGLYLLYSSDNHIHNNTFINNGVRVYESYNNNFENNTVNGKPLIYLENESDLAVNNAGQVILIQCQNITVNGVELLNATIAIEIFKSDTIRVVNNTIKNNLHGLYIYYSENIEIINNTIKNKVWDAIFLYSTSYINISYNYLANCGFDGIYLKYSARSNIYNNTITNCSYGISLSKSTNNMIYENLITNNSIGIILNTANYNNVYLNNFIQNSEQYSIFSSSSWLYSPEPLIYRYKGKIYKKYLGNYWDDYLGVDNNDDGIGDTPYGDDDYPLVEEWGSPSGVVIIRDRSPPQINIVSPLNGTEVNESFIVTWKANDDVKVVEFEVYLDDELVSTINNTKYEFENVSIGMHNITIVAIDISDKTASDTIYVYVVSPNITTTTTTTQTTITTTKPPEYMYVLIIIIVLMVITVVIVFNKACRRSV